MVLACRWWRQRASYSAGLCWAAVTVCSRRGTWLRGAFVASAAVDCVAAVRLNEAKLSWVRRGQ